MRRLKSTLVLVAQLTLLTTLGAPEVSASVSNIGPSKARLHYAVPGDPTPPPCFPGQICPPAQ